MVECYMIHAKRAKDGPAMFAPLQQGYATESEARARVDALAQRNRSMHYLLTLNGQVIHAAPEVDSPTNPQHMDP